MLIINSELVGQKLIPETICSADTLTIDNTVSIKYDPKKMDILGQEPYRAIQCRTRSTFGIRFEIAYSNFYYGEKTTSWIGQHGGPNFNFILAVNQLNFGFRFKPWTIKPKKELDFDGQPLPTNAKLNNIRIDYFVGYSIDFEKLISIEPYVGYNTTSFLVINGDELNHEFSFDKTGGLILGATLNKYFKIKDYEYVSVFGTVGYGFVDYGKLHPYLDNGYFEWNLGIAYKGFGTKKFNSRVE